MEGYTQSTEYTTAAAGLLAIINHFVPEFELSQESEFRIWQSSVNLPTRASSLFGLAAFAKEIGLDPVVVAESLDYDYPDYRFKGYKKRDVEQAKFMSEQHLARARALGVQIEERPIAFDEILDLVKKKKVLLIRLNEGAFRGVGSTSKYVVLYGAKGNGKGKKYLVLDPMQESPRIEVNEELLQTAFKTLTTKKKRDHRMIIF